MENDDPPIWYARDFLTRERVEDFEERWRRGEFPNKRYGQALVDWADLHGSDIDITLWFVRNEAEARALVEKCLREAEADRAS